MISYETAYRAAIGVAIGAALVLVWLIGAVGVLGVEGDPADRMYGGVLGVGVLGTFIARFRPRGMALALSATALAQALVVPVALALGKHRVEASSVLEIVFLNGFFVALFAGSAWLFHRAAGRRRFDFGTP